MKRLLLMLILFVITLALVIAWVPYPFKDKPVAEQNLWEYRSVFPKTIEYHADGWTTGFFRDKRNKLIYRFAFEHGHSDRVHSINVPEQYLDMQKLGEEQEQ